MTLKAWKFIVNPLVQNSNSLLEDLRRLSRLKNIKKHGETTVISAETPHVEAEKTKSRKFKL